MKTVIKGIVILSLCSAWASASIITQSGSFWKDDEHMVFHYFVENPGQVDVFTTSFGSGGFQTVLSLFDDSGNLLFFDTGHDTATDASLSWFSSGGINYLVVLTQWDNLPAGTLLSDGFTEDGNPSFTAGPPYGPTETTNFHLEDGSQRTGDWSVTFQAADPVGLVVLPEPATWGMGLAGVALLAAYKKFRRTL